MNTNLLSDAEFHATMVEPMMEPRSIETTEPVNIWPYVESIPKSDFLGFDLGRNDVQAVRRTGDDRFDHILIPVNKQNVFLVVLVDLTSNSVFGHHLLNLNEKYGLPG